MSPVRVTLSSEHGEAPETSSPPNRGFLSLSTAEPIDRFRGASMAAHMCKHTVSVLYWSLSLGVVTSGAADQEDGPRRKRPSQIVLFLRDAVVAFALVATVLLIMYAYTGLWPPLVVVESDSMMHSEDNTSYVGVIDTGDMVLVKDVDSAADVTTYLQGFVNGHRTYGDYGDVIVYKKKGLDVETPIIHRAVLYLEINAPYYDSYRCEELRDLPETKCALSDGDTWDDITGVITIYHYGYSDDTVVVNVGSILNAFSRGHSVPTSGFITRGDHNMWIDQTYGDNFSPVDVDWIVGKARGEIPWFGLLKLWFTDSIKSDAPDNSVRNLWIAIAIIVIVPIALDVLLTYRIRKKIARKREMARAEYERTLQSGDQANDEMGEELTESSVVDPEDPGQLT